MKTVCNNFTFISHDINDESFEIENNSGENSSFDPLSGVGIDLREPKYYRINSTVFTEPLRYVSNDDTNVNDSNTSKYCEDDDELKMIDNATDLKRMEKRNKYNIDVGSTNPICPQPNCSKTFSSIPLLRAHIRKTHCADRNAYICEHCAARFPARYLLNRHMATHEMRKIRCPVCEKMLSERTNMSVHLRSHTNVRVHECQKCTKKFLRRATLLIHVKFVHRDGDLKCDKCEARFTSRSQWSHHRSTHAKSCKK